MAARRESAHRRRLPALAAAVIATTALAGARASGPDVASILIKDSSYQPMSLAIRAGTTVTWTNGDDEPHTVRSESKLFASGALDTKEQYSFRFDRPGTYRYACSMHSRMTGTIVVQ